jgi:hypothetical protein
MNASHTGAEKSDKLKFGMFASLPTSRT